MHARVESSANRGDLHPWLGWLVVFYGTWLTVVFTQSAWGTVAEHWPIALSMLFGSFIAGSTPMGGGTVGFPVLVLLFDQPASLGKNFGFAVQSIGMVSASILILCLRIPLAWRALRWAMLSSLLFTPLGTLLLAPVVPAAVVTLLFSVLWASFGIMTLAKLHTFVRFTGMERTTPTFDRNVGLFTGFLGGGVLASLTGTGIDLLIYTLLIILARCDLRIAVPTSVVLMAFTSLVGIAANLLLAALLPARFVVQPEVFHNWLAAAPVVALGAPLGAIVVARAARGPVLVGVAILCVAQFAYACYDMRLSPRMIALLVGAVLGTNLLLHVLLKWHDRLHPPQTQPARDVAGVPA